MFVCIAVCVYIFLFILVCDLYAHLCASVSICEDLCLCVYVSVGAIRLRIPNLPPPFSTPSGLKQTLQSELSKSCGALSLTSVPWICTFEMTSYSPGTNQNISSLHHMQTGIAALVNTRGFHQI